jgi:hypothetical protein
MSFADRRKDMRVQAFVAKAAIEAFDEAVLYRFPGPDAIEPHVVRMGPGVHRPADELAAIVPSEEEVKAGQVLL